MLRLSKKVYQVLWARSVYTYLLKFIFIYIKHKIQETIQTRNI